MNSFRKFRTGQGLTQEQMAQRLKVLRGAVMRWEKDEDNIPGPVQALMAVCTRYRVKLAELNSGKTRPRVRK